MDNSIIQHVKYNNIVRTTAKTIEKLFLLYENNKLTNEEFQNKLDRLKELIKNNCYHLIELENEMKQRENEDRTLSLVVEHLNHNACYSTAFSLSKKFNISNDQSFFKMVKSVVNELNQFNFKPALDFCKENRALLPDSSLETKIKIYKFIYSCANEEYQEGIIYLMNELKKNSSLAKSFLPILIDKNLVQHSFESSHKELVEELYAAMLVSYNLSPKSRLTKRVEYGMMAFKTQECFKESNSKCPTCCTHLILRDEIPFNRHEQTIILCRGTGKELNDQNQPYAFDNGHVFGINYINSKNNIVICPKTGKASCKYPKVCYFV